MQKAFIKSKSIAHLILVPILVLTCTILLSGLVHALPVNKSPAEPVSFINAQQPLQLLADGSHYLLQVRSTTLKVQLSNRLLVKTGHQFTTTSLTLLHPEIKQVQQLAKLKLTNWWLFTVNDHSLEAVLLHLQQHTGVLAVQPDMSVQRHKAMVHEPNEHITQQLIQPSEPAILVRLAIIDDGFNFNHPEFAAINLAFEYDADQRTQGAAPKTEHDQHGTLVAGVIAAAADNQGIDGLAPDVELIAIRQVSRWTSDMVLAFSVARLMQADVVNSSWVLPFLPEPLFDLLADWSTEQQPYLVFAAGNNQRDACEVNALSQLNNVWLIGAADKAGKPQPYSNYGTCVSLYAPSQFISTATNGSYKPFTGTSAATAYVSGLIARELATGNRPDVASIQAMLPITKTTGLTTFTPTRTSANH